MEKKHTTVKKHFWKFNLYFGMKCTLYTQRIYEFYFCLNADKILGRDSSVGIATRYGLGGQRIESR